MGYSVHKNGVFSIKAMKQECDPLIVNIIILKYCKILKRESEKKADRAWYFLTIIVELF